MNTKPFKLVVGLTIFMLLISACGVAPVFGSGTIVTETRPVNGFDTIAVSSDGLVAIGQETDSVNDGWRLVIIQDGTESVTVESDDNLMPYVVAEVRDGTLELRLDRKGMNTFRPTRLVLTVHVKNLTGVAAVGKWDISSDKINVDSLNIAANGTVSVDIGSLLADNLSVTLKGVCSMNAIGQVTNQTITLSGTNAYRTADLRSETAKIHIGGTGDSILWVTDFLTVSISNVGTVQYYGNPQTDINTSGTGSVQRLGDK